MAICDSLTNFASGGVYIKCDCYFFTFVGLVKPAPNNIVLGFFDTATSSG